MKWNCVERLVSKSFGHLGQSVARKPKTFIAIPVLMTVILCSGVLRIKYIKDPEYLYSPVDGPAKHERWVVETFFPMNFSIDADLSRLTRMTGAQIYLEAKNGKSIFDKEVFAELKILDQMVRNITVVWDGKERKYVDLCGKKNKKCFANDFLNFEDRVDDMANGNYSIVYPLYIMSEQNVRIFFSAAFPGNVVTDENNLIKSASAVMFVYFLDYDAIPGDIVDKWEYAFLAMAEGIEFKHLKIGYAVSLTLADELEANIFSAVPLFSLAVCVMITFSVFTCLMTDWVRSKPWLGVSGFVSSCSAVVGGFGAAMLCGIPFTSLNLAALFLMLGIGMDNTFVLLAAFRKTDYRLSVEERLSKAYSEAAVSITITSLTNFISFLVGMITPFPSVQIFCLYTSLCILFTYVYQVTFFGGCMAISGRAEKKNLHGLFGFRVTPKSLSKDRSMWYRLFCTGGNNPDDPDNPMDKGQNLFMEFFRNQLGTLLNKPFAKCAVIALFIAYLSVSLWGCTNVQEGIEISNMARYDSYTVNFYQMYNKYFRKYPHRVQVVINKTLDYSDSKVQDEVEDVLQKLEKVPNISGPRFTESWLRVYKMLINDPRTAGLFHGLNMSKKADFYEGLTVFFRITKNYFKPDIKFNDDNSEIIAARFIVQSENIMDATDEKNMLLNLREFEETSSLQVTTFNYYFIYYDVHLMITNVAVQAICVATAVMMLITFLFIPIPSCALWVAFSIISIEVGVVGFMSMWGVNLDMISTLNLILCIGFSVDYSAHISYAYISSDAKDPKEKLKNALHSLGLPIVQGSISTTIGMLVLALTPSYICHVFAKSVVLVVLFGAIHGLFLLPVLLSLSDMWCKGNESKDNERHVECPPPYQANSSDIKMMETVDKFCPPSYWTQVDHQSSISEERGSNPSAIQNNGHFKQGVKEITDNDNTEIENHVNMIKNGNYDNNVGVKDHELRTSGDRANFVNPAFEE